MGIPYSCGVSGQRGLLMAGAAILSSGCCCPEYSCFATPGLVAALPSAVTFSAGGPGLLGILENSCPMAVPCTLDHALPRSADTDYLYDWVLGPGTPMDAQYDQAQLVIALAALSPPQTLISATLVATAAILTKVDYVLSNHAGCPAATAGCAWATAWYARWNLQLSPGVANAHLVFGHYLWDPAESNPIGVSPVLAPGLLQQQLAALDAAYTIQDSLSSTAECGCQAAPVPPCARGTPTRCWSVSVD